MFKEPGISSDSALDLLTSHCLWSAVKLSAAQVPEEPEVRKSCSGKEKTGLISFIKKSNKNFAVLGLFC